MSSSPSDPSFSISPAAARLLDTHPEEVFDRFTRLATQILGVPVSIISILDSGRQFFKSAIGLPSPVAEARETPLSHSFCQHVVATSEPLIVEDARTHDLVRDNLAIPDLGVIAYAGMPIRDPQGRTIGALCAIDGKPRQWTATELELLKSLGEHVTGEVAVREKLVEMGGHLEKMKASEETRHLIGRADRHDLRTPLNAATLNLHAVKEFGDLNEDQKEFLARAEDNLRDLLEMVDRLIDIGNVDSRGQEALNILPNDSLAAARAAVEVTLPLARAKDIQLRNEGGTTDHFLGDEDKIGRVLVNLLANAIKFTPEGGRVEIEVGNETIDGKPFVHFAVSDTGKGIAAENIVRVFEEGFRVEASAPTRRSTGLGLTFCKRIVEAHGGKIWVESVLHVGTIFRFRLPRAV